MSYSQNDEERFVLEAVGDKTDGRFLDVGSWDGRTFSNVYALIERGWSGIMIEPGLEAFQALLKLHGNNEKLTLIHAPVGFDRNMVRFWNTADAVGTTVQDQYEKWNKHAAFTGSFWVPQIMFDQIFLQFGGGFDVISIDTEGTSVDLFRSLNLKALQPKVVCVEHDGRIVEVMQHAQDSGYRCSYTSGENMVLVK